ncbi:MAG: outer membrane efflux protein, partial [uncultured bacterium]
EYKAKKALAEKEEISVRLAKKNRYPDFMLGASWMVMPAMEGDGEETDIGLMAGVELPVWQGKYSSEIKESLSLHSAALNDLKNTENKIKAELQMALFKSNDAQRRITLFRDSLIPKATQAFEVAKEDFSSGKGDFMNLIDAERTFLEFKLLYERAKADNEIACGEIAILINDPFYEKTVNKLR